MNVEKKNGGDERALRSNRLNRYTGCPYGCSKIENSNNFTVDRNIMR